MMKKRRAKLTTLQSVARAVYSRKKVAIFDDVLSGLDSVTEEFVFKRVFSRNGLLRKIGTTVILATHSGRGFPSKVAIFLLTYHSETITTG